MVTGACAASDPAGRRVVSAGWLRRLRPAWERPARRGRRPGGGGRLLLAVGLALSAATQAPTQPSTAPAGAGPSFAQVEGLWNAFWTAIAEGDLAAARRHVHSSRQAALAGAEALAVLQERAWQLAFCRLDPQPFPMGPDEVAYQAWCRHGAETVHTFALVRRDRDGVWRLLP